MNTLKTADEITTAALNYNEDYPELLDAIKSGTPSIQILAGRVAYRGLKAIITPIVTIDADGGHVEATEPKVIWLRDTDGRLSPAQIAQRAARYLGVSDAAVAIDYENLRR